MKNKNKFKNKNNIEKKIKQKKTHHRPTLPLKRK